jgi:hypothetical protein
MQACRCDGRRPEASLPQAGRSLLDQARRWQEERFRQLSAGWSESRCHEFQQAMTDLMGRSYELDA